jgi:hypothetical protein
MGPGRGRCGRRRACGTRPGTQRLAGVLLLVALACVPPAAAAVDITAVVGFADTFRPGHWTPLVVTVTNRGATVAGELEVAVTGGDALHGRQFVTSHRRTLELHPDTRKTFQFVVRPQGLSHPLVIRVRADGQELARAEIDLRARFIAERLLLVLSRDANLDYLNESESSGAGLKVVYPHPELLPVHWRGYAAVAAVVVHGTSLERLSASQFDALHKWIAQGGILAVSGGSDYALLRSPRLSALLPAAPAGMTRLSPDALRSAFSASLDVSRPVHVNRLDAVRGRVHLGADTVPLIVERALGLGRVLYLAFDVAAYPFDRWDGMRGLWLDSLRLRPAGGGGALTADEPKLESPLPSLIAAGYPNFPAAATMFFFLALYLGLLLAAYLLPERATWTRWQALARTWGVPLLFAPVAWLLFGPGAFPREATAVTVALIEPLPGSIYARLGLDLGVYSTRSGPQRLEYRGAEPVLYPTRRAQRDGNAEDWAFGEGPRRFVESLDGRRYVLHALEGEDVIAFHVEASVRDETMGPRLVLENDSGRELRDLWLLVDGYGYEVGSIAAGARLERRLDRAHGVALGEATWRRVLSRDRAHLASPARIVLERKAQATGGRGYPARGHALLIADTASPLQPAGASTGRPRQERALVAFEVAVASDAATDRSGGE